MQITITVFLLYIDSTVLYTLFPLSHLNYIFIAVWWFNVLIIIVSNYGTFKTAKIKLKKKKKKLKSIENGE